MVHHLDCVHHPGNRRSPSNVRNQPGRYDHAHPEHDRSRPVPHPVSGEPSPNHPATEVVQGTPRIAQYGLSPFGRCNAGNWLRIRAGDAGRIAVLLKSRPRAGGGHDPCYTNTALIRRIPAELASSLIILNLLASSKSWSVWST